MQGDTPQPEQEELDSPIGDFYLWREMREIRAENVALRERVSQLEESARKVKRNSRQLGSIRLVLVVVLGVMAIGSAWDVGENNARSFHGERWQAIFMTLVGALGVGTLGFGDKFKKDKSNATSPIDSSN